MNKQTRFLTLAEEVALAAPIRLDHDDPHVCDRRGCEQRADSIVPGAVLCPDCAREFGIGTRDTYRLPLEELGISDWQFTQARTGEYEALLTERREKRLVPATPEREALLSDLIRVRVDEFIRSCGGLP